MVKLKRLDVVFDEEKVSYLPGETISGKVILETGKDMVVKGIHAKLKGKAEVTMFVGDYDTQKECYFSEDVLLFGSMPNDPAETVSIDTGTYEYPFKYKMPNKLPHSFTCEGDENGRVVYSVEAIIHRPGKFSYSRKIQLTVATPLDLSQIPDAEEAVRGECEKVLKCMCISKGSVSAVFSLPRAGFTPGEPLPITGHIINDSKRRIKESYVTLNQTVTLRVYGSSVLRTMKLGKGCLRKNLPPGGIDSFSDKSMIVPETTPSFLTGCHLMDVKYQLSLVIVPAGCFTRRMVIPLSIIIGTDPVKSVKDSAHDVNELAAKKSSVVFDYGTIV